MKQKEVERKCRQLHSFLKGKGDIYANSCQIWTVFFHSLPSPFLNLSSTSQNATPQLLEPSSHQLASTFWWTDQIPIRGRSWARSEGPLTLGWGSGLSFIKYTITVPCFCINKLILLYKVFSHKYSFNSWQSACDYSYFIVLETEAQRSEATKLWTHRTETGLQMKLENCERLGEGERDVARRGGAWWRKVELGYFC